MTGNKQTANFRKVESFMSNKKSSLGKAALLAAGAGAAAYLAQKAKTEEKKETAQRSVNNYRNTERGKNAKNS